MKKYNSKYFGKKIAIVTCASTLTKQLPKIAKEMITEAFLISFFFKVIPSELSILITMVTPRTDI